MFATDQEKFWAGEFGQEYISRNNSDHLLNLKVAAWARMLRCASDLSSIREFGCNVGLNLLALKKLYPEVVLSGYEINKAAAAEAQSKGVADIHTVSILDELAREEVDLTFTACVLIHIHPDFLSRVYENLVKCTRRYVLIAEYYNPEPVALDYRGHSEKLFKRDFAGELIDQYGLKLVDYGFFYKRDRLAASHDNTWFLLEK